MIARIVDDLKPTIIREHARGPGEGSGEQPRSEDVAQQLAEGETVACKQSGYVQEIDHAALGTAALGMDTVIHVLFRPGQFVLRGETLACVWPPDRLAEFETVIERHVRIGRHRILSQDCDFGIAQVVEIAIRALSLAVNDTFTGVAGVDWVADAAAHCGGCVPERRMLVRPRWQDACARASASVRAPGEGGVRSDPPGGR